MSNKKNQDLINLLSVVRDNKELKSELEKFISENNFSSKDVKENHDSWYFFRDLLDAFGEFCETLASKYNVDKESLYAYFSMDKQVFSRIEHYRKNNYKHTFSIDYGKGDRLLLGGDTVRFAFDKAIEDAMNFCQEHVELFPDSTKKYITNQFKKLKKNPQPKMKMKLLSNEFEANVFEKSLPEKIDTSYLRRYFNFIKQTSRNNYIEQNLSLSHLVSIIEKKYPGAIEDDIASLFNSISILLYNNYDYIYSYNKPSSTDTTSFYKSLNKCLDCEPLMKSFFDRLNIKREPSMAVFLHKCAVSKKDKDLTLEIVRGDLNNSYYYGLLPFSSCSNELQEAMLNEVFNNPKYPLLCDMDKNLCIKSTVEK